MLAPGSRVEEALHVSEEQLRSSARGWHGVQLAVIGFIGFCGVVKDARPDNPEWLQQLAGILAVAALVVACVATFQVARVAWPLYGARAHVSVEHDGRRLRQGLALTFLALALLATGTATSWWPQDGGEAAAGGLVSVQGGSGDTVCGELVEGDTGTLRVIVDGNAVDVALQNVAAIRPVPSC
jgi:hypothetical protein